MNRIIPSCRTASHAKGRAKGREGLGAESLHCAALPRTEPRHPPTQGHPTGTNTLRTYSSSQLLHTASEINVIVHVREGDGPWKTAISISVPSFYFHSSSSNQSTVSSVQDNLIILPGSRKEETSAEFPMCSVVHSMAPSLIIDGRVCQSNSEPREERAACSSSAAGQGREGKASKVRLAVSSPLRTGHGL